MRRLVSRSLRGTDFLRARDVVDAWFGHPVGLVMHRLFFEQLGSSGVWLEDGDGAPVGFLLGLVSEADAELAYVHMHVVDPAWRGRGVGARLYRDFAARAHARGCVRIRALAAPDRTASRGFHERLGFVGRLEPGYLGEGHDRIVFERALPLDGVGESPASSASIAHSPEDGEHSMASQADHDDRRVHRREDVELAARIVSGDATIDAQSVNLSEGGILLAGADFPSASAVRIEIELAELGWHSLDAEVVRREDGPTSTLAARFAEVATEGGRDAIRAFFSSRLKA